MVGQLDLLPKNALERGKYGLIDENFEFQFNNDDILFLMVFFYFYMFKSIFVNDH